jgi:hypothetical protein
MLSFPYHRFADDYDLCVALTLFLWVRWNLPWLLEHT